MKSHSDSINDHLFHLLNQFSTTKIQCQDKCDDLRICQLPMWLIVLVGLLPETTQVSFGKGAQVMAVGNWSSSEATGASLDDASESRRSGSIESGVFVH